MRLESTKGPSREEVATLRGWIMRKHRRAVCGGETGASLYFWRVSWAARGKQRLPSKADVVKRVLTMNGVWIG